MLTRRHIRAKVMQSVYAMQQSQSQDLDKELKFLQNSANEMENLYLLLMALLTELHSLAVNQYEVAQKKYLATPADKLLHQKMKDNELLSLIATNEMLQKAIAEAQINFWNIQEEYVRMLYKRIVESDTYQAYSKQKASFEADKKFLIEIFEEFIAPDEGLYEYIEDYNLTWMDDFPIVNTFIVREFKNLRPNPPEKYFTPSLYNNSEEKDFLVDLLKKTALNDTKLKSFVEDKLTNWDKERVAVLDLIILKMAICEFLHFPSIPVKVTINEYLELAKEYSTAKSSLFINGVLNVVHKELSEKELIKKIGRGLL
ncbi:transcription antitermination factor NusB [Capnocytophaga sputigena]|uniref:transcription antitermination factor NusB n=1 Tax=Capnocytophaga sputigena TaxID=1019 RepID=UPI00241DAEB7|nr:transcription antitermination factor NusB [Capnocytophaga sputigena]